MIPKGIRGYNWYKSTEFYKNNTLISKTPKITEVVKEPAPYIYTEWQPDVAEFEDGAREVVFGKVPFLPALHKQKQGEKRCQQTTHDNRVYPYQSYWNAVQSELDVDGKSGK